LYLAPPLGVKQTSATTLGDEKVERLAYHIVKEFDDTFSRFGTKHHLSDERTDGQTDGIAVA